MFLPTYTTYTITYPRPCKIGALCIGHDQFLFAKFGTNYSVTALELV